MEPNPIFLVIEDNLIDQLVISKLLKKVLHVEQIVIANNGREGIEWLTTKKKNQSLIILLDIQMPIMNGFEFLNAFQKLNKEIRQEIQIYVLSSTLDPDELQDINKNDNVTGFLNKPFPIEEFKRKFT
ncbi:response regulator [Flavobacterium sp. CSZ]|uniref:response regulator n=1 Tax=Flavobacterium sp. CSZ TaxID=2783791 RepID=UPI00188B5450|nr:response regulator [Flavobacterium sp. CSZ]MBF4486692.1 response regulator [Flavobacterium sp. CSZ]